MLRDSPRIPLRARPVDALYFAYFVLHLAASLCVDIQAIVPAHLVPTVFQNVLRDYLAQSNDPLLPRAWDPAYAWFRIAVLSEFFVQVPAFTLGIWAMWTNDRRAYPWLILYGTLAALTTLQCLATVLIGPERAQLSPANLQMILQNYIPFMLVPAAIAIDLGVRTTRALAPHSKTE